VATKHPRYLWAAFLAVVAIVLLQNMLIFVYQPTATGYAAYADNATVTLCINTPPTINLSGCSNLSVVGELYSCYVDVTDTQQSTFTYGVQRQTGPAAGDSLFTMSGAWLNFTPTANHSGNYTLRFTADDRTNCGVTNTTQDFSLLINNSDGAPYLVAPIPDKNWNANNLLLAFNLNTYFDDPNNDVLAFASTGTVNIRVDINSAGEALLTPALNWCGTETVTFRATDPTNLSADSNVVTLTVNCVSTPSTSQSSSSSGGGGGGGSASALKTRCTAEYSCFEWSTCQLTRVVSPVANNSQQIEITGVLGSRIYTIPEEYAKDPAMYYSGFQYQECVDTRQCEEAKVRVKVRPCIYAPSCDDNIKNQGEEAIDCGGPNCAACGTCSDRIQNQDEEDVDCGGESCPSCNSCSDGKMNGFELGVDCGGPNCAACATCFDEVQNQDETGVDCGGQFCDACKEEVIPLPAGMPLLTILLITLILSVLLFLFYAAVRRRFSTLLMEYFLKHKKKNRTIIIPHNIKEEIIRRLTELEAQVDKQPMLKSQEELARIIRDYFKESLQLDFEFTYEELVKALQVNKLNPLLSKIMQQFFTRISVLEFSGIAIAPVTLATLIQETRELVYQTAVLTVDDLKEREKDLVLREIAPSTPSMDRGYLLLSQVHLALEFGKLEVAAALYTVLNDWYNAAPKQEQAAIYQDMARVYDEYMLARQRPAAAS
jgi:hypothetical protein